MSNTPRTTKKATAPTKTIEPFSWEKVRDGRFYEETERVARVFREMKEAPNADG